MVTGSACDRDPCHVVCIETKCESIARICLQHVAHQRGPVAAFSPSIIRYHECEWVHGYPAEVESFLLWYYGNICHVLSDSRSQGPQTSDRICF